MASDENSCGCTTQLKMETETEATDAHPLPDELKSKTAEVPEDPHKESSVVCKIEEAELIPVEHATETQEDPFAISTIEALDLQDPSELASDSIKDLSENVTDAILDDKTDLQAPKDKYTAYIIDQDKAFVTFRGTEETISLATTDIPCDQNPIELIEQEEAVASSAPMLSSKIEEHRNFTDSGAEPKLEAKIAVAEKNLVENLQPEFAIEKEAKEPGLLEDSLCPRVDKIKVELLEERERKDHASTLPEKDVVEFDSIIFNDTTSNNLDPECMTELIAEQLQVQSKEDEKLNEDSGQESQVAGAMTYNEYEIDPECKLATADIHNAQVDEDSTSFSSHDTELQVPKFPNGLEVKESRQVEVRNEESLTEHVQEKSQGITLEERIGELPLETDMVVATRDIQTDQDEDFQGSGLVYPQIKETIVRSESETPLKKKHEQAECEHETNLCNDEKLQSDNSGGEDRPHCTTSEKEYLTKLMPEQSESTLDEGQGEQQLKLDVVEATELDSSTGLQQEDKPYEVQEFHCENLRSSYLVDEHETVESIETDKGPSDLLLHTQSEETEKPTFCLANEHHHTGADEATLTEHVQENLENELEEEHRNLVLDLASVVDEASELAVTEALQESSASELLQSSQTIEESQNEQDGSSDVRSMSCEAHPVVTRVDLPEIEHTSVTSEVEALEPQEYGNLEQEQDLGSSILVDEHETEESMKPDTGTPDSLVLHAHIEARVEPILGLGDEFHPTGVNEEHLPEHVQDNQVNAPQEEQENLGLESAEDVFKSSEVGVVTEALQDSSTSELEHEKLHQDHENNWYNAQELQDEDSESSTLVDKYETEASLELGKADPDSILLQTEIQKLQPDLEELLDLGGVTEPLEESLTLQVLETKPIIGDGLTAPLLVQEDEKIGCEEEYKHEPEEVTLKSFPVDELQEQPHFEESNDESIDTIKAPVAQEPEELGLSLQKVHLKSIPVKELHEHPQVEEGNDKSSNIMKAPVAHEPSSGLSFKAVDLTSIPAEELQQQPQAEEDDDESIGAIKAPVAYEPEESDLSIKEVNLKFNMDEIQEQPLVEESNDELIHRLVLHEPEESGLSPKEVDLKSVSVKNLQEEANNESFGRIAHEPEESCLLLEKLTLKSFPVEQQPHFEESNDGSIHTIKAPVAQEPEESGLSSQKVHLTSISVEELEERLQVEEVNDKSINTIKAPVAHEPEALGLLVKADELKFIQVDELQEQLQVDEGNDESINTPVVHEHEKSSPLLQEVDLECMSVDELQGQPQVEESNNESISIIKAPVAHEPEESGLSLKEQLKTTPVDELQEQSQDEEDHDESINTPVAHVPEDESTNTPVAHVPEVSGLSFKAVDLKSILAEELQQQPQAEKEDDESIGAIKAPVGYEPEESDLSIKEVNLKSNLMDELQEQPLVEECNDELIHRLVLHEPEESGLSLREVDLKSVSEANNESFGRIAHEPEESGLLLEKVTLKSFPVEEQPHFEESNDESIDTIKAPVAQEPEESGLSLQKVHLTSISVEELEEHLQVEEVNDRSINTIKAPVAHEPEELGLLVKADELKSIQVDELQEQLQIDEGNDESINTPVVHEPEKSSPFLKEVDLECMSVDELQEQPQVEESTNESISMIKAPVAHEPEESGLSSKEQLKTTPVDELQEQSQDEEDHDESNNTPVAHVPKDESTNTPVAHVPEVSGLSFKAVDLKSILAEELQQQPQAEKEDDESIGAIKAPVAYEPEESDLSIKEVNLKSNLMDELQEQPLVEECNDELIHRLVLHEPEESGLSLREVDLKSVSEANNESFGRIAHEPEESSLLLEKVTLKSFPVEEQPHFEESNDESIDTIKAPVAQEPEESGLSLQKVHLTSISVEELEEHLQVEEVNDKSINTIKAPVAYETEELGLLVMADELKSIQVDELQEQPQIDEGNDESINTPVVHEPEKSSPLLKEVDLECMSVDELQEQPQIEESNNESISMIKAPVAHEPEESGLSLKEQPKTTPVDELQEQSQDEEDHDESINPPVAHVPEDESTNTPVAHVPEETGLLFEAVDLKSILAEELQQQPQAEKEDDESIGAIKAPVAYEPEESDLSIKEVNLKSILMDELQEQPLAEECNDELIHRLVLHEPEESGPSLREVDLKSVSVKHLQEEANNESFGRITHEPEESGLLLEEVTLKSYPVDELQEPPHFEECNEESINTINAPVAQEPEELGLSLQKVHLKSIPVEELQEHPHEIKAPVAHEPEKLGLLEKADELKSIQVHELQEQPQMEEGNDESTNTPVAHESETSSLLLKDVDLECIPVDELQEPPQVEESLAPEPEESGLSSKEVDLKSIVVDELPEQTQVEKGKDESIRTRVAHEPEEAGLLLREVDLKLILVDELQGHPQVEEANNESIETIMADEFEESGPSPKEVDLKLTPVDEFQEQPSVEEANDESIETIVADEPGKSGPSSKEVDLKLTLVDELQKEPSVEEVADESIDTIKAAVAVAHESEESGVSLKEVDLKSILVDELPEQRQVEEGNDESVDTIKAPVTLEPEESGHLTKEVQLKSIPGDELPKWPQVEEGDDELIDTIKAPEAHEPEESGPSIREVNLKAIPVDEFPEQPQVEEDNDEPIHSLVVHELEEFDRSIKKVDLKSSLVDEFQEPQVDKANDRSIHTIEAPVAHESEEPGQGQDQSNYADAEFLSKDNQNVGQVDLMEKEETEFYCECLHDIIVESCEGLWSANQASSQSAIEESGRGFTEEEQITNSSKLHTTSEKPRADIQVTSADTDLDEQFEDAEYAINEDKQPTSEEEDPLIDYVSTNNLRLLDKDEQEEIFAERAFDQQRDIDMSDSGGQNNSDREATAPDNIKVGVLRTTELSTALVTPWVAETKSEAPLSLKNESSELLTKGDKKPAIELKAEKQVLNTKEKTLLHSFKVEGEKEIGVEKVQSVKPRSPSTSASQNIKTQDKSRQKVPMPENTQSAQIDSQRQPNKQSQNKKKKGRGGRRKDKLGWS
ncbi:hypothetical protein O6H91_07G019300 [Diphasiastrum complanatum]|nr:hypothetical protein O6H91_07G019300 [Diphasiastrum complanatum]